MLLSSLVSLRCRRPPSGALRYRRGGPRGGGRNAQDGVVVLLSCGVSRVHVVAGAHHRQPCGGVARADGLREAPTVPAAPGALGDHQAQARPAPRARRRAAAAGVRGCVCVCVCVCWVHSLMWVCLPEPVQAVKQPGRELPSAARVDLCPSWKRNCSCLARATHKATRCL